MSVFRELRRSVDQLDTIKTAGVVSEVVGVTLRVIDLSMPIGAMVKILGHREEVFGEVVGFDQERAIVMPLGFTTGIRCGDPVVSVQSYPMARVGYNLLGRVVNAMGDPIDDGKPLRETYVRPLHPKPVDPLHRVPIKEPLGTGVRSIDAMLTAGRGQRLGIFAGPGVGKSTLMGTIARNTDAAVSVVALVGERGREVRDFIEDSLGEEGLKRSVVVVATGDEPPILRIRAAMYATSVAEFFRDEGLDVVLMMDSVTRFCQAQRQVGLAAGEPPATKGYTPSVFALLPTLLERPGRVETGSITGFYTILVEGDDMTEPISDAVRGILDGHIVLSRDLANRGHYPAVDVMQSVSRVAPDVTDDIHQDSKMSVTRMISSYRDVEDLVNIGAYARGTNAEYDLAIEMKESIDALLRQTRHDKVTFDSAKTALLELATKSKQIDILLRKQNAQAAA